jgi:hypothetical protein
VEDGMGSGGNHYIAEKLVTNGRWAARDGLYDHDLITFSGQAFSITDEFWSEMEDMESPLWRNIPEAAWWNGHASLGGKIATYLIENDEDKWLANLSDEDDPTCDGFYPVWADREHSGVVGIVDTSTTDKEADWEFDEDENEYFMHEETSPISIQLTPSVHKRLKQLRENEELKTLDKTLRFLLKFHDENTQTVVLLESMSNEQVVQKGTHVQDIILVPSKDKSRSRNGGEYDQGWRIFKVATVKGDRYVALHNAMLGSDFEDQGWNDRRVFHSVGAAVTALVPKIK